MKTKHLTALMVASATLFACSSDQEPVNEEPAAVVEEVIEEVAEEVIEQPAEVPLAEKIMGKWQQTHQDCDENGENGEAMSKESFWNFDGTNVTWSKFTHPYKVENGQILIGEGEGSPYEIVKEEADFIVLKAVNTNRFMRLVKKDS